MLNKLRVLAILCLAFSGCETQRVHTLATPSIKVNLSVDFAGRAENLDLVQEIQPGQTVWALLNAAKSAGTLDFKHRGDSETAFVYQINGVENEMADGANWLFLVNGQMAGQGAGATKLSAGDTVLWKFSAEYLD